MTENNENVSIDEEKTKNDIKPVELEKQASVLPTGKCFVLRHIFKNVSKLGQKVNHYAEPEEHFATKWGVCIRQENGSIGIYLHCSIPENIDKCSIETKYDLKVVHPDGKVYSKTFNHIFNKSEGYGYSEFMKWGDLEKDYIVNDELKVEENVTIIKMTGICTNKLRCFDESMKDLSDIVLNVKDEKFNVSKLYLATHSSYFKTMFLGDFGESEKGEIVLTGIDSEDFQKYLEVLYGDYAIDEFNVEGILLVADMYDTPIVVKKCEEFLLEKTKKTLKKKLEMSVRYNLENLKKECLSKINSLDDIRSVVSGSSRDLDSSMTSLLLEKALTF